VLAELLDQVKKASPEFFRQILVEVLVKVGYGGCYGEAAQAVGRMGTRALTVSSRRTDSGSMLSICKPNAGRAVLADPKYKNSPERSRVSAPGGAW
jgi:hypothetical protein